MKKTLIFILGLVLVLGTAAFFSHTTFAQEKGFVPLAPIPGFNDNLSGTDLEFGVFLPNLVRIIIGIAGILAVIYLVIGGVQYVASTVPFLKQDAKKTITRALSGLVLAMSAWLVLYTVDPALLNTTLQAPKVDIPENKNNPEGFQIKLEFVPPAGSNASKQVSCLGSYPTMDACQNILTNSNMNTQVGNGAVVNNASCTSSCVAGVEPPTWHTIKLITTLPSGTQKITCASKIASLAQCNTYKNSLPDGNPLKVGQCVNYDNCVASIPENEKFVLKTVNSSNSSVSCTGLYPDISTCQQVVLDAPYSSNLSLSCEPKNSCQPVAGNTPSTPN